MNSWILDVIVLAILLFFAMRAYKQGFIEAGLHFLPMLAAMGAAYFFAPVCGRLFRQTPLFASLQSSISKGLQLDSVFGEAALETQTRIIEQMQLPDFIKDALLENNNPVVYDILHVDRIQDYISGFLANISVNILSVVLLTAITFFVVKLFLKALNLVFRLPVLSFFNRLCGLIIGTLQGVSIVWLICIVLTFFYYNPKMSAFFQALNQTKIASVFYENNLLLLLILKIFA